MLYPMAVLDDRPVVHIAGRVRALSFVDRATTPPVDPHC
jgi:hypothetical protein